VTSTDFESPKPTRVSAFIFLLVEEQCGFSYEQQKYLSNFSISEKHMSERLVQRK
jgi:hypothetical protein